MISRVAAGLTRFLRTERVWFTPTHDAILLKKALKVGSWSEIGKHLLLTVTSQFPLQNTFRLSFLPRYQGCWPASDRKPEVVGPRMYGTGAGGQITERAKAKGFLPGWLMHLPDGVGKVGRSSLVEHGLDTIHKLKNANKMQVQQALG